MSYILRAVGSLSRGLIIGHPSSMSDTGVEALKMKPL